MKPLSKVDLMILGMLIHEPIHGYELVDRLSGPYMSIWVKVARASVYNALARLARAGLVSRHSERHAGKPERTVYSVTDEGRRAFFSSVEIALGSQPDSMDDFDIALFYAGHLDPDVVAARYEARSTSLRQVSSLLEKTAQDAHERGEGALADVLERRGAIVKAELDFLTKLAESPAQTGAAAAARGHKGEVLDSVWLHELLRNLAAARRSGVLWAFADHHRVGFRFDDGNLTGIAPAVNGALDHVLADAFSTRNGRFNFSQPAKPLKNMVPAKGHAPVILHGCRLAASPSLVGQMALEPSVLLDTCPGYEREMAKIDLSTEERRLLEEVDGVHTLRDLAHRCGWGIDALLTTAFPLWAVGWLVRSDDSKLRLITAVSTYLRRFAEGIELLAGQDTVARIRDEASRSAEQESLPQFWNREDPATRYTGTTEAIQLQARQYCQLVHLATTKQLGGVFVDELLRGVSERIPPEEAALLNELGVLGNQDMNRR